MERKLNYKMGKVNLLLLMLFFANALPQILFVKTHGRNHTARHPVDHDVCEKVIQGVLPEKYISETTVSIQCTIILYYMTFCNSGRYTAGKGIYRFLHSQPL